MSSHPVVTLTLGDPAGTGPEIITRALADPAVLGLGRLVVVGDAATLDRAQACTGTRLRLNAVARLADARFAPGCVDVLDLKNVDLAHLQPGKVDPRAGQAAYESICRATELALAGEAAAIVTSAINKAALNAAGHHFDGHTGLLAHLCGAPGATMMLVADKLRVSHVSTHVPLRVAIDRVRPDRILQVLQLTNDAVRRLGFARPRLAVAGLNPHAGEGGLFGDEEEKFIAPAIAQARALGLDVHGPFAGDTIFFRTLQGEFDAAVAMYHDQGHVAAKMLGIWRGVNVTLGLPIIRTSVEHGTDFANAGTGRSDPRSLIEAIKLAVTMAGHPGSPASMKPLLFAVLCLPLVLPAAPVPPVVYTGTETATSAADGNLRPVVGVQNIEVIRANRTHPELNGGLDHTYTHQPMLAWWHGRFWLEFLSASVNEHDDGMCTSLTTSPDGLHWAAPRVAFPPFALPDGTHTIAHQRMGFYISPADPRDKLGAGGRLLLLSFYGKHPEPNDGTGLGRAVREIHDDGSLGPIYFIRMNAKPPYPGFVPPHPLYTTAPDQGFVAACEALLANKLVTAQWWEEDQLDESGFYTVKGKALSYLHRPDGSALGIWKNRLVATTRDEGHTWTEKVFAGNLPNNASKYWLQHTGDGRYALFLNPTDRLRNPLAVMTSGDCANFTNLWTIHGELPDQRFGGGFKNLGPQYVRGIAEGDGTPPDSATATWVAYSVNKEDIWIARVPVPLTATAGGPVNDTFEADAVGALPAGWNVYSPLWAPVRVVGASLDDARPGRTQGAPLQDHALELRDEDPYDYARVIRVFPATHGVKISFRLLARQANARCEIDLLDAHGARPVRLALGEDGHIRVCHEGQWMDGGVYTVGVWHRFELEIPVSPTADRCALTVDGKSPLTRPAVFTDPAASVERLSFRTGAYRDRGFGGRDLPGADDRVSAASFLIDDVVIAPVAASAK